jgi:hypothetical protein
MKYDFSSPYSVPVESLWRFFPEKELHGQYSNIPLAIVLIVMDKQKQDEKLSLKGLYSYFSCSHLTVKKFVDALCASGYLQTPKSTTDSRVKYILMTDKCSVLCQSFLPKPLNDSIPALG